MDSQERSSVPRVDYEFALALALSDDERRVLTLYDTVGQQQLERALLKAQLAAYHEPNEGEPDKLHADHLLESRASYAVWTKITESTLVACPILRAVHTDTHASPIERDLLPYVKQRDQVAIELSKLSVEQRESLDLSLRVRSDTLRATRRNTELASELLSLTDHLKDIRQSKLKSRIESIEAESLTQELAASRQKWRVMKGVASALVAGSGIDWTADKGLQDAVLDAEDDG